MNAAQPRVGDWMAMASGRIFWPLDPRADEVHIEDIAQALSNVCRFGGRCSEFYSVAQHSVWVARYVEKRSECSMLALHALLHDAAEAYLGDVIRPLKPAMVVDRGGVQEPFAATEERVMLAIYERFRIFSRPSAIEKSKIKIADDVALATEARDLMGDPRWPGLPEPAPERIEFLTPRAARTQFLNAFRRLKADAVEAHFE